MKVNDALIGWVLLLLALLVLWHVQDFPSIPGQDYGAALFPKAIATGLGISAMLLILQARRAGGPWLGTTRGGPGPSRRPFLATLLGLLGYVLVVEWLGFLPTASLLLALLFWAYGVKKSLILPITLVAVGLVHSAFYGLLKVPLPWGVLAPVAW